MIIAGTSKIVLLKVFRLALACLFAGVAGILSIPAFSGYAGAAILNESMTGTTAGGWVIGGSAYLTASTGVDAAGDGWLRLTEPTNDQAGFAMLDSSFDISQGVVIQYDYATWGGSGADGYSIYLFDGSYDSSTFAVGASGGSLGYDKKTVAPIHAGLTGGYIGVGVDEYGNFSNPTEGRSGGPGLMANSVAVRGPYNHPTAPYYYLGGTAANIGTLWFNQSFRPGQTSSQYRKVVIYLTPVAAPNYMRVDAYLQYGYNQPLTQVVTGLYTGVQIPATVKVGYAASTGGSTNYHEIRNLTINPLPSSINLAITNSVSSPTVAPGGSLTYTVTARNYVPVPTTATNVPIVDTLPTQLTGVTWTCSGSTGGTCGAASGSGNLNTTATLPFNGSATYTITGTVNPSTVAGTVLSNTASLTAPTGITDYNPADNSATVSSTVSSGTITVSGAVYNDNGAGGGTAHDGVLNGSEAGVNAGLTYYAKIFRSSDLTTTVAAPVQVNATTGTYSFSGIPGYGTYTVILSSTNTANVYDPSFPSANWIAVAPVNYTMSSVVASGANLTNQNFFLYNGSRISGIVINDNGANGAFSTAYDGILNAAETGISGVTVRLADSTGATTYDTTTTGSDGRFVLYTNTASANLRVYETNPAGYLSVSYNAGTTGGSYSLAGDYVQFAYTQYTDYGNILFGDVPPITATFTPTPRSAGGTPAAPVYYAHTFTATGRSTVTFSTFSRTQGSWSAVAYYRDVNCSGVYAAGDTLISGSINAEANENVCILAAVTIPNNATPGATDQLVTRASFSYGLINNTLDVTDTTTVGNFPSLATSSKSWVDQSGSGQNPGDVLQYSINIKESNGIAVANASVNDVIDTTNLTGFAIASCPGGATCSYNAGVLSVTGINVTANGSASIVYNVTIANTVASGTTINNTAVITNPGYPNSNAVAPTVTVSGAVAGTGNKRLYLYDSTSTPAWKLSRTPNTTTTIYATINTTTPQTWTMNPAAASAITIDPAVSTTVPVVLNMRQSTTSGSRTIKVDLQCSAGGTILTQSQALSMTGTQTAYTFNLPLSSALSCGQGNTWTLKVSETAGTDSTRIYPYSATVGAPSRIDLPATTVINVNSTGAYNAAYPGGSALTTAAPGSTVYIRSVVSDPFGSYDIFPAGGAAPAITIKDPSGTTLVNAIAIPLVATGTETPSLTKTFEYAYTIPSALQGNLSVQVTAAEGTEGTVSNSRYTTLPVFFPPSLTVVKSASPAAVNPGQVVTYSALVSNAGTGAATSVVLTDQLSPFVIWSLNSYGTGVPFSLTQGTIVSGLTLGTPVYSNDKGSSWTYIPTSGGGGAPAGYDANVTNWQLPMLGTMNAGSASFTINYKVMVK